MSERREEAEEWECEDEDENENPGIVMSLDTMGVSVSTKNIYIHSNYLYKN